MESGGHLGRDQRDREPPMPRKPITDALKDKLDELEVERHLAELAAQAEDAVIRGVTRAGEMTHENRDRIGGFLDRAAQAADRRTDGRYADRIGRVRSQVDRGVDRLADQRPGPEADPPPSNDH
jgi:hypothetical protein